MAQDILLREDRGAVATLTLNNPAALNALSEDILAALEDQFQALATDARIRAVILKGAGKAFCAGHDLKEMTRGRASDDGGRAYFSELFNTCSRMMMRIRDLPQPVIAQVHGIATAAGCQLVATCDMAIAANSARFGVNGVNIGLFCSTPMVALSRNVTPKLAMEMLTTGQFLSAEQAAVAGLINRAVADNELSEQTTQLAETVASKLGVAVRIGKQAFYKQREMTLEDAYAYTADVMATNMLYRETEKGIAAFIDKRTPEWDQD